MAQRPFDGPVNITQEYGAYAPGTRRGYHTGVDYGMAQGTPVLAPEAGTIVQNGDGRATTDGRGYFVTLNGDSGVAHCLYHLMRMGAVSGRVTAGQVIGYSGNTGDSSGPHLHWETRHDVNNNTSDFPPANWLFGSPSSPPNVPTPTPELKEYVRIVGDYRTLYDEAGNYRKATLSPNQYGGLEYEVLGRPKANFINIQTQMFGRGAIYVGADVSNLTTFYRK